MKYKFIEDFDPNSSQGKILQQISPGSVVLECGCATGYMTKYMKEKLGCTVYIIEYDVSGYEQAISFAEKGFCGDLMDKSCFETFADLQFDYILFADVLEHLYDPRDVLKRAVSLLKETGTVMVSLPNIAHNDILAKLWSGSFQYTEIGLLDETHIRFWGRNDLDVFFRSVGLTIVEKDYTTVKTMQTEQYLWNNTRALDSVDGTLHIFELLQERTDGEIYQFVLKALKTDAIDNDAITVKDKLPNCNDAEHKLVFWEEWLHGINQTLSEKNSLISEKNLQIEELNERLRCLYEEREQIINSKSWRITKPLRIISNWFSSNA